MKVLLSILLLLSLSYVAQNSNTASLVVIHYDTEGKEQLQQSIYYYNFVNNAYANKEKIITVIGKKNNKDYIRFDLGENTLYKERYLISSIGNVVDLKEKKVIYDGNAQFVKCTNDSVILFTNDAFKGKYYSVFDLKTNQYAEIKNPSFKPIVGQNVELDKTQSPYKLVYFPQNKPKVILMEDAGHGGVTSLGKKIDVPLYWIDDNVFLFPNIKITDLEGSLVKYTLSTQTVKKIGGFSSTSSIPATYKLAKAFNSSFVEFYFKDKLYLINPIKETMLLSNYKEVDGNFSVEVFAKEKGRSIWYKGKEIGVYQFQLNTFKTTANYAAMIKEITMDDETYQQGISVYITANTKWQNIATTNIASIAGWIK